MVNFLPKSAQPGAKKALQKICNAEDRDHAEKAVKDFGRAYSAKWPNAVKKIAGDVDELLAFYDFPAEHWGHLHSDNFWRYIKQGWIPPYLPEAHRQNQVILQVLVSAAFGYASAGNHVVYDGVVGPWFIDPFRAAAKEQAVPLSYVILRPNQHTTLERATGRTGDALTAPEPIR
ncbi:transposase [Streptomyces sp. NPDC024089]|uniref:transposase n=1 Tax=Streptomyces sp. NPDC024089 TaxID=3154328 RepID=UPI0033F3CFE1